MDIIQILLGHILKNKLQDLIPGLPTKYIVQTPSRIEIIISHFLISFDIKVVGMTDRMMSSQYAVCQYFTLFF